MIQWLVQEDIGCRQTPITVSQDPCQKKRKVFALGCHTHDPLFDDFCRQEIAAYEANHPGKGISSDVRKKWIDAAVWLISALHHAHHLGLQFVILPRGKGPFRRRRFGYQASMKAVEILSKRGWVSVRITPKGLDSGEASELIASDRLSRMFERTGMVWSRRRYDETKEVVILRERDDFLMEKFTLPTPETPEVSRMRAEVHEINSLSLEHAVFPFLPDSVLKGLMHGVGGKFCDFSSLTYRRIFALGRPDKGGRLYGGWWQQIPAGLRPHIRINDEPTVELDFGATIVTLLYGLRGLMAPNEPYDLGVNPELDPAKRSTIKKYIAALLNAKGSYQLPPGERELLGLTSRDLRALVEQKHTAISNAFGTGIGLDLMYLDSQISLLIQQYLLRQQIPVLNIHDGFIAPSRYERLLHDTMMDAFKQVSGIYPTIKRTTTVQSAANEMYTIYRRFLSGFRRSANYPDGCLAPLHM